MQKRRYKIIYTYSSRSDIRQMKKYILDQFKYRELGENLTRKMKEAANGLKTMPGVIIRLDFNTGSMIFI